MKALKRFQPVIAILAFILLFLMILTSCNNTAKKVNDSTGIATDQIKKPKMDLGEAAVTGNIEVVKQHIAAGSDLNVKDPFGGSTPLITASVFGQTSVVIELLKAGAEINVQNNDGSTALHSAAFFGHKAIVEILLQNGADKTIKNSSGSTALQTVSAPFSDVKPIYDYFKTALEPMGLVLDYEHLVKVRPEIEDLLK